MLIGLGGALRLDQAALAGHAICSAEEAEIGTELPPACPARGEGRVGEDQDPGRAGERAGGSSLRLPHSTRVAIPQIAGSAYFGGPDPGGGYRVYLLPTGLRDRP